MFSQRIRKYYSVIYVWRLENPNHVITYKYLTYLFSDNSSLLFTDLYKEQLPITAPPTYRGIDIKYFYKITISTQRVGSRVQMLNIPIRILPLPIFAADEAPTCDETNEELAPTNPFLENKNKETKLEISLHHLQVFIISMFNMRLKVLKRNIL